MKVKGQLERAQLEDRTSDYAAATANGMIWFNNVDKDCKFDDGVIVQKLNSRDKETSFTLPNNTSATDVTGLNFSSSTHHRAKIEISIRRRDDSQEKDAIGAINVVFKKDAATWGIETSYVGDDTGVTFTITAAGQIQYATTNYAGANYAGFLRYDVVKRYANFSS